MQYNLKSYLKFEIEHLSWKEIYEFEFSTQKVIKLISINKFFSIMRNTNKTVIYRAFHANVNTTMEMETKISTTKKKRYGLLWETQTRSKREK